MGGRQFTFAASRRAAFTLAELLVTLTLTALLTVSIVSGTQAISRTRVNVETRLAASAAARQGLEAIVAALRNVRRDPDQDHPAVVGRSGSSQGGRIDLQVISDSRARSEGPECDQYEMSFYLMQREGDALPVLISRKKNALTDQQGAGGMATVVAEGIVSLSFQYYGDGAWQDEWTPDEPNPPAAVRVMVAAVARPRGAGAQPGAAVTLWTTVAIHANPPEPTDPSGPQAKGQGGTSAGQGVAR